MKIGPYELGPNDTAEQGIYTGDAKELSKAIPDESIDLIFTDPVYDQIDDYRWLAETAARVLKPDGLCAVFAGVPYLPETHDAMRMGCLTYRWRIIYRIIFGGGGGSWRGKIQAGTQELLLYERAHAKFDGSIFDFQMIVRQEHGKGMRRDGRNVWGKPADAYMPLLNAKHGIVFDPFTGGGTVPAVCKMLGRHYLAFEIDADVAERARERVRNTQPPLFIPEAKQMTMDIPEGK